MLSGGVAADNSLRAYQLSLGQSNLLGLLLGSRYTGELLLSGWTLMAAIITTAGSNF